MARIGAGFEVHDAGEIWGQTLWDLRDELGSDVTEALVTKAMRLSNPEPAFLDMRDSILAADTTLFADAHEAQIWDVFTNRGMGPNAVRKPPGQFARLLDEDPQRPSPPPPPAGTGTTTQTQTQTQAQPPPPAPQQPAAPATFAVTISDSGATRVRQRSGRFTLPGLRFACPGDAPGNCRVVVTASSGGLVLARGTATIKPGKSAAVKLRLNRRGRKLLRKRGRLNLRALATTTVNGADPKQKTKSFVLRR